MLLLFVLSGAAGALYLYLTWHFNYWTKRGVPGPRPTMFFGNFPGMVDPKGNFLEDMDKVYRRYKGKHRFIGVFSTRNPQLMILDPGLAKEILTANFRHFQDNEASQWTNRDIEPISGQNPFVLPATAWRVKRAEFSPGLTLAKVRGMFPILASVAGKFRKFIAQELQKGRRTFDAKKLAERFTAEMVADVVWGIEADAFADHGPNRATGRSSTTDSTGADTFLGMSRRMIAQTYDAFFYFFVAGIFPLLRRVYNVRFFPVATDRYFLKLQQLAFAMRFNANAATAATQSPRQDFLQFLIELQRRKCISDVDVVAHMLTFHFDGFETSATLIAHCLLMLARHPDVQQKLRSAIADGSSETVDDPSKASFDELQRLPCLDQCIAETLRIFTPLPFMAKVCTEPCELANNDGARVPLRVGDVCLIPLISYHHDEAHFPAAESFAPERFGDDPAATVKALKDRGVYMPFGDGPRICLGMTFGLAQTKMAVAEVVKHFRLTVDERTRSDNQLDSQGFIVGLKGGIHLNFEPINI